MENAKQEKMNTSFIINTSIGKGICYVNKNNKTSDYSVKFKINNNIVMIVDAFKIIDEFSGIARENTILYDDNNKCEAVLIREFIWTAEIAYNNKDKNIIIERFCEIVYKVREILINYYRISKTDIYHYYYINYNYIFNLYEQDYKSSKHNKAKLFFMYELQNKLGSENIDEYIKEIIEKLNIDSWNRKICIAKEYWYTDNQDKVRHVPERYRFEKTYDYLQALKCRIYLHTPIEWISDLINTEFSESDLESCFKEISNFRTEKYLVKERKKYMVSTLEKNHYNEEAYKFIDAIFNKLQELIANIESNIVEEEIEEIEDEIEDEMEDEETEEEKEDIKFCKQYYSSWVKYIINKK